MYIASFNSVMQDVQGSLGLTRSVERKNDCKTEQCQEYQVQEGHRGLLYKRVGMLVVSFKDKGPGTFEVLFGILSQKQNDRR